MTIEWYSVFSLTDYNKLSASSGGIILHPSNYMQGRPVFSDASSENYPEPAFFGPPSLKVTHPKCHSGYQTLGGMRAESPIDASELPSTSGDERDPFQQEQVSSPTTMKSTTIDGVAIQSSQNSASSLAWKRNLSKKGIVSSSFVWLAVHIHAYVFAKK